MVAPSHSVRTAALRSLRGCIATEVALCVPPLLLLALAAADFGRVAYYHQAVCNAARIGAQKGAMQTVTSYSYDDWKENLVKAAVEEMSNLPDFDPTLCVCQVVTTTDLDGHTRTRMTVEYSFHTAVKWPLLPHTVPLERTVEFRQFR